MKNLALLSLILLLTIIADCAPTRVWTSDPAVQGAENPYYGVKFEPKKNDYNYFNSFLVVITNKTKKDLIIDWNKTRYLYNNKAYSRFVFAGVDEKNVNNLPPDIVPTGGTLTKVIFPLNTVAWKPLQSRHVSTPSFSLGPIPEGESGIYLVIIQEGQERSERITVTITVKTKQ